jgi:hypothetical protein
MKNCLKYFVSPYKARLKLYLVNQSNTRVRPQNWSSNPVLPSVHHYFNPVAISAPSFWKLHIIKNNKSIGSHYLVKKA